MLTILGRSGGAGQYCDGVSRRNFIKVGGMTLGTLSLPQLLQAEAAKGEGHRSHKAVINVFLPGGPPHQDMWDLKQDAPSEIRGEFRPIGTSVPGIEICELFPKLAKQMEHCAIIRSVVGAKGPHYSDQCVTGWDARNNEPAGGWPSMGAWVSKLQGPAGNAMPPHVSLMYKTRHAPWGEPGAGGFLGLAHAPFRLMGGKGETSKIDNMVLKDITLERLQDRAGLLKSIDSLKRDLDSSGAMDGMDAFTNQALGILTSSKLADAMDLSKEDPATVERYGKGDPQFRADGAPKMVENLLIARRLVEAGARVVSLNFSRWDWHGGNFKRARQDMPMLDQALAALIQDLVERNLDKDVSVVCWGEFGRTPKINANAGRDHWPRVSTALLACGGMRTGQVIGSTNRLGEYAVDRPIQFQEILATLYHNLGIDLNTVREFDLRGRPQYPVAQGIEPIRELV
ncbi:hypothetical protein CA51_51870 [Rosistilla oblonga]|uniref:DUF1501 domain-containing protein n=1 Tax=Rosistilla oblonga TaxID=2527990 RepID=UPI00118939AB|nr:DUF1501 domain-containing protein [Rosistilla oblonga]QDV15274.1 hypothetical protein CA51_51870 [Rosistilla oblonga]